ncbi:hypothetical protein [Microbacterium alcoholitolerans]|uniref:hypothetical protein n=1 Tax=unclassified Microbacterium TaxID=2609290 RepID=UPI003D163ED2
MRLDRETGRTIWSVVRCARPLGNVELDSIWENQIYPLAPAYELCGPDGEVVPGALPQSATLAIAGYDTAETVAINTADALTLFEAHAGE